MIRGEKVTFQLNLEFGLFPEMGIFVNGLRVNFEFERDVESVQKSPEAFQKPGESQVTGKA